MAHWLVLGGTGFVGRALCEALSRPEHAQGPRLLVPSRRPAHGQPLRMLPRVDLIEADVHDDAALAGLVAGADAVVNLVAILHGTDAAFERVHVALPQRLAAACQAVGVRRVVHVSAIGATPDAPSRYLRSKARGEAVLRGSGLGLTVLRPSVIFGAGDKLLNLFAALQRFAPVVPLAGADARFQPVWVGDVVEALARCLEHTGTVGQTFECTGPEEMTLADLVRAAGRYAGHERPVVPLPDVLARLQARLMEWAPGEPLMSRDNLDSMRVPNVATPGVPGLAALGITASPLSAVAPGYLAPGQRCGRLDAARAVHR
jgi:NADH dehydrogenase